MTKNSGKRLDAKKAAARVLALSEEAQNALLRRIVSTTSGKGDIGRTCGRIGEMIGRATKSEVVAIERVLPESDEIEYLSVYGIRISKNRANRFAIQQSPTRKVYSTGKPVVTNGTGSGIFPGKPGTFISIPMKSGGKVVGAMSFAMRGRHTVTPGSLIFLNTIASVVQQHVSARLHERSAMEAEEKLRHLFDNSIDALLVVEPEGHTIVDANKQALLLAGHTREMLIGRSILALHAADDASDVVNMLGRLKNSRGVQTLRSAHLLREGGRLIPVEVNARLVKIARQRRIIYEFRDITEERKAEVQLNASEELLRLIVEGTPDVFFYVHNTKGIFTYVSPSVEKITGHDIKVWKDHYTRFVTDSPINEKVREYTERAITRGETPPMYHAEVFHADGRRILLEIHEKPIFREGKVIGVQGVARDITEQQRWQRTILESEKKYRSLFNSVRDGIFQSDADGRITDINLAGAEILGYTSREEVTANNVRWPDLFVSDEERRTVIEKVRADGFLKVMEFAARRMTGDFIIMEGSATGVFDEEGNLSGYDGTFRDITERKRLEEQLIQSQKMESIGLLAGGIAHDFNNILGGILGYASYLKTVVPAGDKIQPHLETIERSAIRAAELTSKLLAFARGGKYVVRPISINAVIDETIRLLRGSLDKSVTVEDHLAPDLPAIEADAGQIQQVLMNLCVNARDAMPGGGRMSLASELVHPSHAFLSSQTSVREVPYIRVSVSDTGMGIEKSILNKIFDPFFSTKEKGKGTGLGLATVYGIVKNHNGYIEVESEVGAGSRFILYFPSVAGEAIHVEDQMGEVAGGTETVLVVDDEDTIRSLVRDLLTERGYHVMEAAGGAEAVEVLKQHKNTIALVVLDMVMPEMGGRETFIKLKSIKPDVRAILSTGYAEDERTRELLSMGVKEFVQKPYRASELASVIRRVLDA